MAMAKNAISEEELQKWAFIVTAAREWAAARKASPKSDKRVAEAESALAHFVEKGNAAGAKEAN